MHSSVFYESLARSFLKMFIKKDGKKQFDDELKKLIEQNRNMEIRSLIGNKHPSKLIDSTGQTLLHLSAKYNNYVLTKYLIKHGCEINAKDNNGVTPLLMSATANSYKSAAILLDANADVCVVNDAGKTVLQVFLNSKNKVPVEIINRCLERVKRGSGNYEEIADKLAKAGCPLDLVVKMNLAEVTKIMVEQKCIVDNDTLLSALYLAMKRVDLENTKVLLERVGEVSVCKLELLEFLLHVSVKNPTKKNSQIYNNLLLKINDWESLDEQAMSFIESIVENGSKNAVKILFDYNVDSHVRNVFCGRELLAHVFANRNAGMIDLIPMKSFDVNCRGKLGNTPLKLAVKNRAFSNVQLLLDMNADPNIADNNGWVPMFEALSPKNIELEDKKCVELLLQYGAELQVINKSEQSLIDWALVNGDFTLIEPVLAHLAILETLGQPILPKIQQQINLFRHLRVCYENYHSQLERMKQHEICPNVTLFTVLTKDSEKIAPSMKNTKTTAMLLQSNTVRRFHWYYVSTLKKRFGQATEIVQLRNKAAKIVAECTNGYFKSTDTVIEKIIDYLNYDELYAIA